MPFDLTYGQLLLTAATANLAAALLQLALALIRARRARKRAAFGRNLSVSLRLVVRVEGGAERVTEPES